MFACVNTEMILDQEEEEEKKKRNKKEKNEKEVEEPQFTNLKKQFT